MNKIFLVWALVTIGLVLIAGNVSAFFILAIFFILSFRRPITALEIFCFVLPIFGNGPGRPLLYLFDAIIAIIILQWYLEKNSSFNLKIKKISSGNIGIILLLWLAISTIQLFPVLWLVVKNFKYENGFELIKETLTLGETSSLYVFSAYLHRTWYIIFAFFILFRVRVKEASQLLKALLAGTMMVIGLGFLTYFNLFPVIFNFPRHSFGSYLRLQSFFANPGWLSEYLCFMLPIAIAIVFQKKILFQRRTFSVVLLALILITLFLTFTRAGWVASIITILIIITGSLHERFKIEISLKRVIISTIIFFIFLSSLVLTFHKTLETSSLLHKKEEYGESFSRVNLWKAAELISLRYPLIGSGLGTYWVASEDYIPKDNYLNKAIHNTAHNTFLNILAEEGLLGYSIFLILFFYSGFTLLRKLSKKEESYELSVLKYSFVGLWFILLIYGMFQYLFYLPAIALFLIVIIILPFHRDFYPNFPLKERDLKKFKLFKISIIIVLLISFFATLHRGMPYQFSFGFYKWEGWGGKPLSFFRWTKKEAVIFIRSTEKDVQGVVLPFAVYTPDVPLHHIIIKIYDRDKFLFDLEISNAGPDFMVIPIKPDVSYHIIRFQCNRTWNPNKINGALDKRDLGIATGSIKILKHNKNFKESIPEKISVLHKSSLKRKKITNNFKLFNGDKLYFPPYSGLRYLITELKNPYKKVCYMVIKNPNGLQFYKTIKPGFNRINIQIPPEKKIVSIAFFINNKNVSIASGTHLTPWNNSKFLHARLIKFRKFEKTFIRHFILR